MSEFKYVVTVKAGSQRAANMEVVHALGLRDTPDSAINWAPIDVQGAHAELKAAMSAANGDSNDEEIQALQEVAACLEGIVGEPDYQESEDHA